MTDVGTKSTIKHEYDSETRVGFSLYSDWMDECLGNEVVNLRLDGIPFETTCDKGGMSVTLAIPLEIARKLGLMPPDSEQTASVSSAPDGMMSPPEKDPE